MLTLWFKPVLHVVQPETLTLVTEPAYQACLRILGDNAEGAIRIVDGVD